MKAKPTFSLKDQLFNPEKVAYLTELLQGAYPELDGTGFQEAILSRFPELELKQRISHIAINLRAFLPADYLVALEVLLRALPPELDPTKTDDDFGDFIIAPFSEFVAQYGCSAEYLARSLAAMKEITKRFSAEGPIRDFINAFPDETFTFLTTCAADDNYHVRRLASEGTRPKLPWAQKLVTDYQRPLPILDTLFADHTRYVTRSVANHLNDLSKIDPDLVIGTLRRWQQTGTQAEKEMAFITNHSLRTLVKQGHQDALDLLGFGEVPDIAITKFETTTPEVVIGNAFEFTLALTANRDQNLMIDYHMLFAGDGKRAGQKIFKLKQLSLKAGQSKTIKKKHPMRLMTTRRLLPGTHTITLQINGQAFDSLSFELRQSV